MIRFVDLFAGTGGMRLGLEQAAKELSIDTECVFSSEIDKNACQSYQLNFGENPYCDVREGQIITRFRFYAGRIPLPGIFICR